MQSLITKKRQHRLAFFKTSKAYEVGQAVAAAGRAVTRSPLKPVESAQK
jgi:hypothetical protein